MNYNGNIGISFRKEGEPGYAGQCAHGTSSGLSDGSAGRVDQGESLRRSDGGDQEEPFLGEAEEARTHGSAAESVDGVRDGLHRGRGIP